MNPPHAALPGSRDEFDEQAYLARHADVARAVAAGVVGSGWQHYRMHGAREGRPWPAQPNRLDGVVRDIAPTDGMFIGNTEHYFDVGESAVRCIYRGLAAAGRAPAAIRRILDLPCGHGRVLRFIRRGFPQAHLTACDLNRDAVGFCARTFGALPVVSSTHPPAIPLRGEFDLIWCGSLFTHLPEGTCAEFLQLFRRVLAPGGVLVLSLHGRHFGEQLSSGRRTCDLAPEQIAALLAAYRRDGFGFVDYGPGAEYGFSLTDEHHVRNKLLPPHDWQVLDYHERGWDYRQDVVTLRKAIPAAPAE